MKVYAERPGAAFRQVITDLLVALWVYAWVRAAFFVHEWIDKLAVPGEKLAGAGDRMAEQLRDAGNKAGRVPVAGDDLKKPFTNAGDAASQVADVGREQQEIVHQLALVLAIGLLVLPLGLVLLVWLPRRLRWMSRAGTAAKLRTASAGRDLLALRALATQPLERLTRLDPDIAAAWRRGDGDAVRALAELELSGLGLRRPRTNR
ncbi:hypothetical protein Val02_39930 [Virgisporangium aliadipatigenens]|uniref:Transmembrane protein n=1 Tax=Virgisporangium aliadipatigenens TaxID=741659 RepID=A0A8J3YMQ6_9ACTN|nr:hypothetical protein [Virgisporangium aliadipatigenens]GIJ47107.1 hypothetical protein Val02_39930 [Virgisporangium aliadipatigenens]